ncbi:MAG: biotin--[acetyl-CoA-carboxylase] ligase [Zoogloeaceae bacterium]|nr:biotin--[acetyl-CoA-carboxylase] ligase [Zoogloeaceae bacterium]
MPAIPHLSTSITAAHLGEAARHFALEFLEQCDSTNDALAARPVAEADIQVVLARSQTAGRGRRGRSWLSAPGQGLTFSCGWNLPDSGPSPAGLSLVAGLALAEALESLGARGVRLKWPNDLLAGSAKLGGILIELVSGQRRARRVIIGIGLNLRSAGDELPPEATALHQHIDHLPADEAVLARILLSLHARLQDFATSGFAGLRAEWQARDAFAGRMVRVLSEAAEQHGRCEGVDADGALLLGGPEGMQRILSGDVSLRPAS